MNNTMFRFEPHSHTHYSNLRLLDSINKPKDLVDRAIKLGLKGVAITDHEALCGHIELNMLEKEIQKTNPDFKIALGNEIYLVKDRTPGQPYYHFILIAKNEQGHKALRELSSHSWMLSYVDRNMERVPTTYDELSEIVKKYPNSLIATTACLGGEFSSKILELIAAEKIGDDNLVGEIKYQLASFLSYCKDLFGEDFYIECAPGCSKDQRLANERMTRLAAWAKVKMVIGTDAHYLTKQDRYVHKAFLTSQGGEREVDAFYEYSYLQTNEEIFENLSNCHYDTDFIKQMFDNSMEIYNKIETYSLLHKQSIPKVKVKNYLKTTWISDQTKEFPTLAAMYNSDDPVERYWVNECINKLDKLNLRNKTYLDRLEEEANIKKTIGEKLETNMFRYPVTLQHYVDLFWECGSTVGAGRGSACAGLNHYLLGVTQLDPIVWNLPFWRYLNEARVELGDIDIDLCPSKRGLILDRIKEERGQDFLPEIDCLSRQNLGCTLIATFGTETSKAAIKTACRGYRSEEYPDGLDPDTANYLTSLIPVERGFVWSLEDVYYGDEDSKRKPVASFVNEINKYPGLFDIALGVNGLISRRGSHASGVIMFDEDPYAAGCFMKTPSGEIITQYDLHMCEAAGLTKYDFLVTEVQDKITETISLLQENKEIEDYLTLREVYNKYLHPEVINIDNLKIWEKLHNNSVINVFQFDSPVGAQAAKKIKPSSMIELADANGLMRLMTAEKGKETPMEKYIRFKNDISLWYDEMTKAGLTKEEQKVLEPHFLSSYGVPPSQEQMMTMLMDENICGFTLEEANLARKIVGKKQMSKIPELEKKVMSSAKNTKLGQYVWKYGIGPQLGYSFSIIHALAYSFIGYQTLLLATEWNPVYWNTACLIVNSGSLESEGVDKSKGSDYAKVSKAVGDIISAGVKVSLVDINNSAYGFKPDARNNQIFFGLKALSGINAEIIEKIISLRPFISFKDFCLRCALPKTAMLSLIKGGAFDNLEKEVARELNISPRELIMIYYGMINSEPKKKLTLQNFNGLVQKGIIPDSLDFEKKVYAFNKALKANCKRKTYYILPDSYYSFYTKFFPLDNIELIEGEPHILQKTWDTCYKNVMDKAKEWLKNNQEQALTEYNNILFKEWYEKNAEGSVADWEMDALCFYYGPHALSIVNTDKYGINNFFSLPTEPEVEYYFKRNNRQLPIYKTTKIMGTVLSKNDTKSSITLLTIQGIVTVKFTKEYYAMFARQLSEKQADGTKKVMEKGWFRRGVKVLLTGYRKEDMFITKTYKHTPTHQIYKIENVSPEGDLVLVHERYNTQEEGDLYV